MAEFECNVGGFLVPVPDCYRRFALEIAYWRKEAERRGRVAATLLCHVDGFSASFREELKRLGVEHPRGSEVLFGMPASVAEIQSWGLPWVKDGG